MRTGHRSIRMLLACGMLAFSTTYAIDSAGACNDDFYVDFDEECDEPAELGRCENCQRVSCAGRDRCDVLPSADTVIAGAENRESNFGTDRTLIADSDPRTVAYLKFDLRDIRGRVLEAKLELTCTDGTASETPDFGTIYPVRDSSWLERHDPQTGEPGLRWIDVDVDGDGAIGVTERSRYAPLVTHPVAAIRECIVGQPSLVVVTPAFQDGRGIYSVAIATNDRDAVAYASREHPDLLWRPVLHLRLAPLCGDGKQDPGEACDDGNDVEGDACDSNCTKPACGNGVVAPGEECDDGNRIDGDCCTPSCTVNTANELCARSCCARQNSPGCDNDVCTDCVRQIDVFCVDRQWDERCAILAATSCTAACLCDCQDTYGAKCDVRPSADTYIEGPNSEGQRNDCEVNDCATCGQVTWVHGGRDRVDVDGDPLGLAYFKFDLRRLTRPVRKATLELYPTNASLDGPDGPGDGGHVYRLRDSSWLEGDCDGLDGSCACVPEPLSCACEADTETWPCQTECAACPGSSCDFEDIVECKALTPCTEVQALTFFNVDTNHDKALDARDRSPYLPDFARDLIAPVGPVPLERKTIDVTTAFESGAVYSLVIAQTSHNGTTYTSREYLDPDRQPVLRIEVGCASDRDCAHLEEPCIPVACEDRTCVPHEDSTCRPCRAKEDCDDKKPCTIEHCIGRVEGCGPSTEAPVGLISATCALQARPPDECGAESPRGAAFVGEVNELEAETCMRLKTACSVEDPRPSRKQVLRKAVGRLFKRRRKIAIKAPVREGQTATLTSECAAALIDRFNDAVKNLKVLSQDTLCAGGEAVTCPTLTTSSRRHRKGRRPAAAHRP